MIKRILIDWIKIFLFLPFLLSILKCYLKVTKLKIDPGSVDFPSNFFNFETFKHFSLFCLQWQMEGGGYSSIVENENRKIESFKATLKAWNICKCYLIDGKKQTEL